MRKNRNRREDFDIYSDDDFDIIADDDDLEDFEDEVGYDGDYRDDYSDDYRDDYEDDYRDDPDEGFEEGYEDDYRDDFYDFDKEDLKPAKDSKRFEDYDDDDFSTDYEDDEQEDEYMRDYKDNRRGSRRSKRYRDDDEYYEDDERADYDEDDDYDGKGKIPRWAHFVVLGIIVVIILYYVIQFVKWDNSSIELKESDEKNIAEEIQDYPSYLSDEQMAGHNYDDEEMILMIGNDAITFDMGDTGIASQIEKATGATCISAGFPESTIARSAGGDDPLDAFCFPGVIDAITTGDYSKLHDAAGSTGNSTYEDSVKALEDVDFDKIDTLVVDYNAQDLLKARIGRDPGDPMNEVTYSGALASGIKKFKEKYPHIRVVFMTLTYCYGYDKDGKTVPGDKLELGNGDIFEYFNLMMMVCSASEYAGVSVLDNYNGNVSEQNSKEMLVDNIHVSAECNKQIAEHFAEFFGKIVAMEKGTGEEETEE